MGKQGWLVACLLLVGAAAVAVWLDPTYTVSRFLYSGPTCRGRPLAYWQQALASADPALRAETLRQLKEEGPAAVPVLLAILKEGQGDWTATEVRCLAADLLGQTGGSSAEAIAALTAALQDPEPHVRIVAAGALGLIGPPAREAIPALTAMLQTPQAAAAIRPLSCFGSAAQPAVPHLIPLLQHADADVRWNAARTLGKIRAVEALGPLLAALQDEHPAVREHAAEALGDLGPPAKDAIPALITALADEHPRVRRDAARSLGQLGPAARSALGALKELAQDPDPEVRAAAARSVRILETDPAADPGG